MNNNYNLQFTNQKKFELGEFELLGVLGDRSKWKEIRKWVQVTSHFIKLDIKYRVLDTGLCQKSKVHGC